MVQRIIEDSCRREEESLASAQRSYFGWSKSAVVSMQHIDVTTRDDNLCSWNCQAAVTVSITGNVRGHISIRCTVLDLLKTRPIPALH